MSTHPAKPDSGNPERPSGTESKDNRRAQPGGHRTHAGGTYGDFVPDAGQPRSNDDRDRQPGMGDYYTGGGNLDEVGEEPASPHPQAGDPQQSGSSRTGSSAEQVPDPEEAAHESNKNKSFDTAHVHSGTTSRKV